MALERNEATVVGVAGERQAFELDHQIWFRAREPDEQRNIPVRLALSCQSMTAAIQTAGSDKWCLAKRAV
jgi:hypothetical protein